MIIKEHKFKDVYEIQLESISDNRGYFKRVYDDLIFKEHEINKKWVQENHSHTIYKDTIRGMHFQFPPYAETKLVRVVNGIIYDVFIDLRKDSNTFGKWDSIILSANNNKMILIPRGFAHGYCTLTNNCDVLYKVDNYYTPTKENGIIWNDNDLNIDWYDKCMQFNVRTNKSCKPIISEKDSKLLTLKEFIQEYKYLDVIK